MPSPSSAPSSEFAAHCIEMLGALGPTRAKRMFGGHGFYVDEVFIALAVADRLYLKADAQTRATFEAAGCMPFVYDGAGKQVTVSYWTVPDDAMESPHLMRPWARLAMEAGLRARAAKAPARKKPKTASVKPAAAVKPKSVKPAPAKRAATPKKR